ERADVRSVEELRQEAPLLLRGAEAANLVHAEVCLHRVREADRRRCPGELLDDEDLREITEPGAAELGLERHAEKAQRAEPRPQLPRELVLAIDLGRTRRDPLYGEPAHVLAEHREVFVEAEIEVDHAALASGASMCAMTAARKRVA